jgi:hypothetical protein
MFKSKIIGAAVVLLLVVQATTALAQLTPQTPTTIPGSTFYTADILKLDPRFGGGTTSTVYFSLHVQNPNATPAKLKLAFSKDGSLLATGYATLRGLYSNDVSNVTLSRGEPSLQGFSFSSAAFNQLSSGLSQSSISATNVPTTLPGGNYALEFTLFKQDGTTPIGSPVTFYLNLTSSLSGNVTLIGPGTPPGSQPEEISTVTPFLQWTMDANRAIVSVYKVTKGQTSTWDNIKNNQPIFSQTLTGSSLQYPSGATPLLDGETYYWSVKTQVDVTNRSPNEKEAAPLVFKVQTTTENPTLGQLKEILRSDYGVTDEWLREARFLGATYDDGTGPKSKSIPEVVPILNDLKQIQTIKTVK